MILAAALLAGALLVCRPRVVARLAPALAAVPRAVRAEQDPMAVASSFEVLAVCLSAGMAVSEAARATAASAPPSLAVILSRAADLLALGAHPDTAWEAGERTDDQCAALVRLARRSASSGAALAAGVAELAEQSRQATLHRAEAAAQRASVVIAGPLGLCFLPAFVCLGIVPVVAGLADDVLGAGLL
jgi:pilus assembly protein TadC